MEPVSHRLNMDLTWLLSSSSVYPLSDIAGYGERDEREKERKGETKLENEKM
jgi:hypothetical protein